MSSSKSGSHGKPNIETTDPEGFRRMIVKFREIMEKKCKPLSDEPDYFTCDLILTDFLRARKYNLDAAVEMLTAAVEWRRSYRPLKVDCHYCHEQPGYHCIRQVGHDKFGRPILYACFAQAFATKNHSADTIEHCVQMLENARRSFKQSATQVLFIFDCTGMTLPCCNPKLGKKMMHIFADFYPERLGTAIIVNHKTIFQSIWRAIRKFLDPITAAKVVFLKHSSKRSSASGTKEQNLSEGLRNFCDEATAQWLETEMRMNKEINEAQMRFWEKPPGDAHDPRGTEAFLKEFVECESPPNGFVPHPNIVDLASGKLAPGYPVRLRYSDAGPEDQEGRLDPKEMKEYGLDGADAEGDEEELLF